MDLPKTFDEFVDARKQGFIRAKEFKDNGGKLAGCLCSYTPQELLDAAGVATVGLCGTSSETIPDAEKVLPKNLCLSIKLSITKILQTRIKCCHKRISLCLNTKKLIF